MNVALIGSVSSSYHALRALIRSGVEVTGVLGVDESRADRVGDYRSLRGLAESAGLAFRSFIRVSEPAVEAFLKERTPDLLWCVGLSQMIPDRLLHLARRGGVGFHPTMLPEGRGRAPVAWTLLRGARAAVSLFYLAEEPDAGDLLAQREVPVRPDDYSEDLIARTNEVLEEVLLDLAPAITSGDLPRVPQDHAKATYYPKRTAADGRIDWTRRTEEVYRLIRAAGRPYHGAFTFAQDRKLIIWRAKPVEDSSRDVSDASSPGWLIEGEEGRRARTGDGWLALTEFEWEDAGGGALRAGEILS